MLIQAIEMLRVLGLWDVYDDFAADGGWIVCWIAAGLLLIGDKSCGFLARHHRFDVLS